MIAIVILAVFVALNLVGVGLYHHNNKSIAYSKEWWSYTIWNVLCGITYVPYGLWVALKKRG